MKRADLRTEGKRVDSADKAGGKRQHPSPVKSGEFYVVLLRRAAASTSLVRRSGEARLDVETVLSGKHLSRVAAATHLVALLEEERARVQALLLRAREDLGHAQYAASVRDEEEDA